METIWKCSCQRRVCRRRVRSVWFVWWLWDVWWLGFSRRSWGWRHWCCAVRPWEVVWVRRGDFVAWRRNWVGVILVHWVRSLVLCSRLYLGGFCIRNSWVQRRWNLWWNRRRRVRWSSLPGNRLAVHRLVLVCASRWRNRCQSRELVVLTVPGSCIIWAEPSRWWKRRRRCWFVRYRVDCLWVRCGRLLGLRRWRFWLGVEGIGNEVKELRGIVDDLSSGFV